MDAAHLHLLVNHFPIVLAVVGALTAVLALFTRHRSTWIFSLAALALAGITVYPALFTGEGAEQVMRNAWYVRAEALEVHEQAAEYALWVTLATGLVAIGAMWRERTAYTGGRSLIASPGWLRALLALLGLLSAAVLGRTAWTSLEIVHRAPALQEPPVTASPAPAPADADTTAVRADSAVILPPQ